MPTGWCRFKSSFAENVLFNVDNEARVFSKLEG